jgi:hypothetical protein
MKENYGNQPSISAELHERPHMRFAGCPGNAPGLQVCPFCRTGSSFNQAC